MKAIIPVVYLLTSIGVFLYGLEIIPDESRWIVPFFTSLQCSILAHLEITRA